MEASFSAELWESDSDAAWVFATLPEDLSDAIAAVTPRRPGFGSVRVEVSIGDVKWRTSVFPDSSRHAYVLPVKRVIRERCGVASGDLVDFDLALVV